MFRQTILASLAGGVIVFALSAVQHMVLRGVEPRPLPAQSSLLPALRASIPQSGFYFFPGRGISHNMSKEERDAAMAEHAVAFKEGPSGVIVFRTGGQEFQFGRRLGIQFALSIFAALVAAMILALNTKAGGGSSYALRVGVVALLGVFAFVYLEPQYWNWYGFPGAYTCARTLAGVVGWTIAGLAMAAIIR